MKKIFSLILTLLSLILFQSDLKSQCNTVTVDVIPVDPQSGPYNYFGVKVTLPETYSENVTVSGYIYDEGDPNTNHPFELTVYSGYLTAETSATFYQTCPTCNAVVDVSNVSPCPEFYDEAEVAYYSLSSQTFTINLDHESEDLIEAIKELFSIDELTIDSLLIDDDDPATLDSAAYLTFYATGDSTNFSFGIYLKKLNGSNQIIYTISNQQSTLERVWECKQNEICFQCGPKKNWFLGPVVGCKCLNSGMFNDCIFNSSGQGIPWTQILTLINTILLLLM